MRKKSSALFYLISFFAVIALSALIVVPVLLYLDNLKGKAIERLEKAIKKEVVYTHIGISFDGGIGFRISGLAIRDADGSQTVVDAEHIFVGLDLRDLLRKKVSIDAVYLYRPRIFLSRDSSGRFNIADLFSPQYVQETYAQKYTDSPAAGSFSLLLWKDRVVVSDGEIFFRDNSISDRGLVLHIEAFNLKMQNRLLGSILQVEGSFMIEDGKKTPATIRLKGGLGGLKKARSISEIDFEIAIQGEGVPLEGIAPYLGKGFCGETVKGRTDLSLVFKGRYPFPGTFQLKATAHYPQWVCPSVYEEPLHAKQLSVESRATLTRDALNLEKVEIDLDQIKIQGQGALNGIFDHNLHLNAHLFTDVLPLPQAWQYLPTGVLKDKTWEFLIAMTKGGRAWLDADLNGTPDDFTRLDMPEGQKVLRLHIRCEDARVVLPVEESYLPFTQITGMIDLKDGHLFFRDFSAYYGDSYLSHLEGWIQDIHRSRSHLDVKGMVRLAFPQVIHELDHGIIPDEVRRIARSLRNVSGRGDLSLQVLYDYGKGTQDLRVIGKTSLHNGNAYYSNLLVPFQEVGGEIDFTDTFVALRNLKAVWGATGILVDGRVRFNKQEDPGGTLHVTLDPLPLGDLMQLFGKEPDGSVEGMLSVRGMILFSGASGPRWKAEVTSPGIRIYSSDKCLPFKIESLSLDDDGNLVQISDFQWQIKGNKLSGKGALERGDPMRLDLHISSSSLDCNNLFDKEPQSPLRKLLSRRHFKERETTPSFWKNLSVTCHLGLDRAEFRKVDLSSVSANAVWEKGVFNVHDLRGAMDGGSISLISTARKEQENVPFHLTVTLDGIDINTLLSSLEISDNLFQGALFLSSEIQGVWKEVGGWKKDLSGDLYLDSRGGVIQRYEILTKVLTLINFTQWSSIRLSDLKARGLPYQRINGHISIGDGLFSTEDVVIDTSIASVAVLGSYNYLRDNLDLQLAVRPLEQLDHVIDRLPVVGRILKGKDGTTMVFYYKLSGHIKEPEVALVPFKRTNERIRTLLDKVWNGIESGYTHTIGEPK